MGVRSSGDGEVVVRDNSSPDKALFVFVSFVPVPSPLLLIVLENVGQLGSPAVGEEGQ